MPIVGIGTDIVSVKRISQVLKKNGEKFCARILTDKELAEMPSQNEHQLNHFVAKRWAAKEAIAKAFGTGIGKYISFHDLIISHNSFGVPKVVLSENGKKIAKQKNIQCWHISISDEENYAIAYVIASG